MFEERLRLIEGAEVCRATGSGMAAVFAALASVLKHGDRLVASRALFGSCLHIVKQILPRYGGETEVVDGRDLDAWRRALSRLTKLVFCETPSNPTLDLVGLASGPKLTDAAGGCFVMRDPFAFPPVQRPPKLVSGVRAP